MLALHGSLTQSGMWIAPAEAAGTIRMLCPDQCGFGRSEDPGGDSCAEFASDALALAQYLLPERYVVMAHSFACAVALEVAHSAAGHVIAVVLVDPVVRVGVSAAPAAPSPKSPEIFATLEEAGRYFRDTEEGKWTDDTLRRFVQDIMMRDGESGLWRFPYAPAMRLPARLPTGDTIKMRIAIIAACSGPFPLAQTNLVQAAYASVLCPTVYRDVGGTTHTALALAEALH